MRGTLYLPLFYKGRNQGIEINLNCSPNRLEAESGFKSMQYDSRDYALNHYANVVYISAMLVLPKLEKLLS